MEWEHEVYGNRFECRKATTGEKIEVWAWNRQNARRSAAKKFGVKPDKVSVSQPLPPKTQQEAK